jgi:type I restriction enzyme, S subunit
MEVKPGYKRTDVGVIPKEWAVKPLGSIAQLKNGYAFKSSTYTAFGTFNVVTIANVQDGFMDVTECNKIDVLPRDIQPHHRLEFGEILISMTGNVGRVCRVTSPHCLLNQRVGKLVPLGVDGPFLFLMLGLRRFLTAMAGKAKGGAQGNLSVSDITDFLFPLPPTKAEQQAIAEALGDADAYIEALEQFIAKKRQIKQGAMQELLTGKMRLPGFGVESGFKQTEVGAIPEDWEVERLSAICAMKSGESITSANIDQASKYPCYVGNGLRGFTARYTHDGRYGLIGRQGALCGNVLGVEGQLFASEHAIGNRGITPGGQACALRSLTRSGRRGTSVSAALSLAPR